MEKKKSELLQTLIFFVIVIGNLFLMTRYFAREDLVGTVIFLIVVILAGIAAFGHFLEWMKK